MYDFVQALQPLQLWVLLDPKHGMDIKWWQWGNVLQSAPDTSCNVQKFLLPTVDSWMQSMIRDDDADVCDMYKVQL